MSQLILTTTQTEKLIELVRSREGLYDQASPEYRDQVFQQNAWKRIAEDMGFDSSKGD